MKAYVLGFLMCCLWSVGFAQDWADFAVPANPGQGKVWELQDDVSDDFNYDFEATSSVATIGDKWTNFYHNGWTGPSPTVWKRDHVFVNDGKMKLKASRVEGENVTFTHNGSSYTLPATYLGCVTSTKQVQYPVYVETFVKITKSVLASDVWMLSADDTQEIDICEAYGSSRWTNEWFSNKRLHLSHHVFIRSPFQDWQPSDAGSFYTDGTTIWSDGYHRIGVYWKDPWNLEYYVDGQLVRTRSGVNEIDPKGFTNGEGLSKPMDIIINTEDQTWRAVQGLTPTAEEIANTEDHTFKVDWIRVYKPVAGEVGPVTNVTLSNSSIDMAIGDTFSLIATVEPANAIDKSVTWESDNPAVATVNESGTVQGVSVGMANIIVTTNDGQKKDTCIVTITNEIIEQSVAFDNDSKYLSAEFQVGGDLTVTCNFHAGTGNTVTEGVKFWLREIKPGWSVANDYIAYDYSVAGSTSGTATATISLDGVPATSEIPADNWYFLFVSFNNSEGSSVNKGIYPIMIVRPTGINDIGAEVLKIYPNPVRDYVHINSVELFSKLVLYSLDGKVVYTRDTNSNSEVIQTSTMQSGIYILQVMMKNGDLFSQKVIIL